jgi:hypothetical protein
MRFRAAFPDVPVGIASFTDRVLPHLFPSPDDDVFTATLNRSLGIDRPPPHGSFVSDGDPACALESIVSRRFFTPTARKRLIFVITDGECPDRRREDRRRLPRPPGVDDLPASSGTATSGSSTGTSPSRSTAGSALARHLDAAADTLGGHASTPRTSSTTRSPPPGASLATGRRSCRGKRNRLALAPYLAGAIFLPLTLLLWRRDR